MVHNDDFIYVGGYSQRLGIESDYDYIVLKIDYLTGDNVGIYRYNGPANGNDRISAVELLNNGQVVLTGVSKVNGYYWTTQLLSDVTNSINDSFEFNQIHIYPNPVLKNGIINIDNDRFKYYEINSIDGIRQLNGELNKHGVNVIKIDNLQSGIYLLLLINKNETLTKKFIIK